ncbi:MAG TPA: ubiquinone biosynthesis regulatory protein kinase UbiB, partial [Gammaproteobacteria bacterium]|nr:ubiquinone biosynthesis regulatory protein kinase UbiB [Gammaproteobacteria bacterium]
FATHLLRPFRFLLYLAPWFWFRDRSIARATRIRRTLEDLGPIFVKFGQMLSTRRDLLPLDIADELARLQDKVPPFSGSRAREIVEQELQQSVTQAYQAFDEQALASASIAQVHAATLLSGEEVVVKVLRPGMHKLIQRDIDLLYLIARLAQKYWSQGKRLRPVEVVAEYEKTIFDELDLMREAANAAQLKRNFTDSPLLYVPNVYWPQTTKQIMTMERIHGIPVSDIKALHAHKVNMRVLAERGVEIFFTQVFGHNFFHADMHPGNIFIDASDPELPRYLAVDFGIIGTLSEQDQYYLAANFIAFFNRDYYTVAKLHVDSGWVPAGTRVDDFESAIRTVCEPIFDKPLKEISFGQVLLRLFQTAQRFNMEIQPQLVLLQKTLLNVEGLGRDLYPDLDLWQTAKPYLEQWMKDQVSPRTAWRKIRKNWPQIYQAANELPDLLMDAARDLRNGTLKVQWESEQLSRIEQHLRVNRKHSYLVGTGTAVLLAGTLLTGLGTQPAWLGLAGMGAGLGILIGGFFISR